MKIKTSLVNKSVRQIARFEVKAVADDGTFEGYGSVFGVKDSYGDVVDKGAFVESIAKHKGKGTMPALLWQHNPGEPIGVWTEMSEDEHGLFCKGQLVLGTQRGAEAHALLKAKAISGLSIGFIPLLEQWDNEAKINHLQKVDLWETSIVTFPANQAAQITVVKNTTPVNTIREFEAALRDVMGFSAKDAKALASAGWPALKRRDDDGAGDENATTEAAAAILALAQTMKATRNGPAT